MIKRRRFPKIFFGWWTVLAAGFLSLWGHGVYSSGMSALFKPISSELGLTRAQTAIPTGIGRLEGGLEGPLAGWVADRFGPRGIVTFGVFFVGLSLILMNYVNSLWGFFIVWGVLLGTAFNLSLSIPLHTAISNWFVKKRGLAISIHMVLAGLSGVLAMPLFAWLISTQGWRMACVTAGVVMLLIGLPLSWFCFKPHRPEYYGLLPDGATAEEEAAEADRMVEKGAQYAAEVEEVEFTLRQALKTPVFWVLAVGNSVHSLSYTAIQIHMIPLLTDMGVDALVAAGMLALVYAVSIPGRLVNGLLADRVKKGQIRYLMALAYFVQSAGLAVFLLNQSMPMIYLFLILFGIGKGLGHPVNSLVYARYFGRKAFGSIRGIAMLLASPVGIVAPIYAGWVYDTTGSYMTFMALLAILGFVSTAIVFFALPPKPPAQITDVRKIV